jgi:hypothetical protein
MKRLVEKLVMYLEYYLIHGYVSPQLPLLFCQTVSRSAASPSVQTALQPAVLRVGEDGFVALEKKSQRVSPKFEESLRRSSPRTNFTAISRKFRIEEPNVHGARS